MKYILIMLMVIAGLKGYAQENFTGTWKLIGSEHINGPTFGNALLPTLTITQSKDSLIIVSPVDRKVFALNGSKLQFVNPANNRTYIRNLAWSADKKSITLTSVQYIPGDTQKLDLTRIETLSLSSDGNTLIWDKKSIETQSESWEEKGTYQRQ